MKKRKLLTISILLAIATGLIYVGNKLIFATAVLKDLLKSNANNFYNWRFGKIYYKKQGKGSPVLLIHDLTIYSSAYEWNRIMDNLSQNHTVYAIDLPGCGRSDKQNITYTNYLYVQAISDFIKNIIQERTDLIVSGYSGSLAVMAYHVDTKLFGKLIMINPPSFDVLKQIPNKRTKIYKFLLELPVFGTLVYNMISCQSNVELLFTEKYLYNPFNISAEWIDTYYESAHRGMSNSKYLLSSMIGRYTNNNICHALKEINQSIFIIEGELENDAKSILTQYESVNPAIESIVLKHAKHLPQLESPERLLEHLNLFLE